MPMPVSETAIMTYWPGLHVDVLARHSPRREGVAGLDGQLAAVRHGVARVDGEVEQRVLELRRVGLDRPQARRR